MDLFVAQTLAEKYCNHPDSDLTFERVVHSPSKNKWPLAICHKKEDGSSSYLLFPPDGRLLRCFGQKDWRAVKMPIYGKVD